MKHLDLDIADLSYLIGLLLDRRVEAAHGLRGLGVADDHAALARIFAELDLCDGLRSELSVEVWRLEALESAAFAMRVAQ